MDGEREHREIIAQLVARKERPRQRDDGTAQAPLVLELREDGDTRSQTWSCWNSALVQTAKVSAWYRWGVSLRPRDKGGYFQDIEDFLGPAEPVAGAPGATPAATVTEPGAGGEAGSPAPAYLAIDIRTEALRLAIQWAISQSTASQRALTARDILVVSQAFHIWLAQGEVPPPLPARA